MMTNEVKELLRDRAEHVHLHGDFAPAAFRGARRVRTRRAVTTVVAGLLALAVPYGVAGRDHGTDRGEPATRTPAVTATQVPERAMVTATARSGASTGPMPVPYVQQGLLRLSGRTIRVSDPGRSVQFFGTLSNGGVVFQVAGPNPDAPGYKAGAVTFLDPSGRMVREHPELTATDVDGLGDVVTSVDASGAYVALDVKGELLGRFMPADYVSPGSGWGTGLGDVLGDLVAVDRSNGYLWLGNIATGRSRAIFDGIALHGGRSLVLRRGWSPNGRACNVLENVRTGERVRELCDSRRVFNGFSPAGDWIYGALVGPSAWVERTDDGARLLEIRADTAIGDELAGLVAPSPDGSALLVAVTARDGTTVTTLCAIRSGECTVLGDGEPATGEITLPMNWGR